MKLTPEERELILLARATYLKSTEHLKAPSDRLTADPAPVPDEVAEIERKHESATNWIGASVASIPETEIHAIKHYLAQAHLDRDTLLRIIRTQTHALVDREALAKWFQESIYGENWNSVLEEWELPSDKVANGFANALLSSDIVRPMPTREAFDAAMDKAELECVPYYDAFLALLRGK